MRGCEKQNSSIEGLKQTKKIEKKNDVSFVFPLLSISWLVSGRPERLLKVYRATHNNLRPHPALGDFPRF